MRIRDWLASGSVAALAACASFGTSEDAPDAGTTDATADGDVAAANADGAACACVPSASAPWSGPGELSEAASVSALAPCDDGYGSPVESLADPIASAASCSCKCSGPTGATCPSPPTVTILGPSCAGGAACGIATFGPACVGPPCSGSGLKYNDVPDNTGTCTPAGVTKVVAPVVWKRAARACAIRPGAAACAGGGICAPARRASSPLCIWQDGDVACPSGSQYASKVLYYGGADDTRDCADTCACGVKAGDCSALYSRYADGACTSAPTAVTLTTGSCTQLPSSTFGLRLVAVEAKGAICTVATPATPTGSAKPARPVTFCCSTT